MDSWINALRIYRFRYKKTYWLFMALCLINSCVFIYLYSVQDYTLTPFEEILSTGVPSYRPGTMAFVSLVRLLFGLAISTSYIVMLVRSLHIYNPEWKEEGRLIRYPARIFLYIILVITALISIYFASLLLSGQPRIGNVPVNQLLYICTLLFIMVLSAAFNKKDPEA